jgi:hypothetical protein
LEVLEAADSGLTSEFLEQLIIAGAVNVKKLKELDLSDNELTWFDFKIFTDGAIETVNLSGNTIEAIILPVGDDGKLTSLTSIDLSGNNLSSAALDFSNFVSLSALNISNNPNLNSNNVTYPENYPKVPSSRPPSGGNDGRVTVILNAVGGKFSGATPLGVLTVTTKSGVEIARAIEEVATFIPKPSENADADTSTHYVNSRTDYEFNGWYASKVVQTDATRYTTISSDYLYLYAGWTEKTVKTQLANTKTVTTTPAFSKFKVNKISGKVKKGKKLTAKYVKVKAQSGVKYAKPKFQWYQNGKKIKKATKSTFKLTSKQKGKRITVKVTYKATPAKVANVPTLFGSRTVSVKTTYKLLKKTSSSKTSKKTSKVK